MARPYQATFGEREMQQERVDFEFASQGLAVCETGGEYCPRRPEESVLCLANTPSTFITLTFWFGGGRLGSYDQGTVLHDCPAKRWI
jgi:hypothetical protein